MSALITGMGAVSSVGADRTSTFDALCAGRSGLAPLRAFAPAHYRARHAYEIDDRPASGEDRPLRPTDWLLAAVAEALADAGRPDDLAGVPVLVGTTLRELRSVELRWCEDAPFDPADLHFGTALRRRFGADRTYTVGNACAASLYALGLACDLLDLGEADTVVVAGTDTITESTYGMLDRVYREAPDTVLPFDRRRRGMLQGDGAAAVVLTRDPGTARAGSTTGSGTAAGGRDAAHARVRSVGLNCDAHHPSAPDRASIGRAMRQAHTRAGVTPADIDLVMLHGTGTPHNDRAEALALTDVFAADAARPHLTAVKSMIGHTAGASGLHSLIVAVQALTTGRVPPTLGLTDPIDEVRDLRIGPHPVHAPGLRLAQVDAFGFGGLNAVAVVERAA
ncbi:beta-ketoacyl synthase N-terminal-like domain-containing protein [Kitasatospora sp. NPDC056327]|uniref:beta-ketoacyl synthase N-terminal-like domain-containing protein n=1 Tax=Kitasatospora sp. NPDC056327 TaxID=3345785 RepID=UPI0035DD5FFA